MLERIMREYQPAPRMPRVSAGRTRCARRAVAAHREPVEMHGEDVEQQHADHELRRRDADEGERPSAPGRRGCRARARRGGPWSGRSTSSKKIAPTISSSVAGRRDQISVGDLGLLQVGAAEIALQRGCRDSADTAREAAGRGRAGGGCSRPSRGVALRPAIMLRRIGGQDEEQEEGDERDADQDQRPPATSRRAR